MITLPNVAVWAAGLLALTSFVPQDLPAWRAGDWGLDSVRIDGLRERNSASIHHAYASNGYLRDALTLHEERAQEGESVSSRMAQAYAAEVLAEGGHLEEAARRLEEHLAGSPSRWATEFLGEAYSRLGRFAEAEALFEEHGPSRERAEHWMRSGRFEDALAFWRENPPRSRLTSCIAIANPIDRGPDPGVALVLARCLRGAGRPLEAVAELDPVLERRDDLGTESNEVAACARLWLELHDDLGLRVPRFGTPAGRLAARIQAARDAARTANPARLLDELPAGPARRWSEDSAVGREVLRLALEVAESDLVLRADLRRLAQGRALATANEWLLFLLGKLGDPVVLQVVDAYAREDWKPRELLRPLTAIRVLGTPEALARLEAYRASEHEALSAAANDVLRRWPRDEHGSWPVLGIPEDVF